MIPTLARKLLPSPALDVMAGLLDSTVPRRRRVKKLRDRDAKLARRVSPSGRVLAGPFAGMWMDHSASWGGAAPYLAGTYEQELHEELERLVARKPSIVIDIGAAEGYYAVGLALRLPRTKVVAFDIDRRARRMCGRAALINGVTDRLTVREQCVPEDLNGLPLAGALVLSDCEGGELTLLDPAAVPGLAHADIIVEMHDFVNSAISATIMHRFELTHFITVISATRRDPKRLSQLRHLPPEDLVAAVDEGRPVDPYPMQWAVMIPSTDTNA